MSTQSLLEQIEAERQQSLHRADDVEREAIYATRKLTYGDVALLPDHVIKTIVPEERLESLKKEAEKFSTLSVVDESHQSLHLSIQDIVEANRKIADKLKSQQPVEQSDEQTHESDDDLLADETDYQTRRQRHYSNYRSYDKFTALTVGAITVVVVLAILAIWYFVLK